MLPHFTKLRTAFTLMEPIYPSLFEITIITPNMVRNRGYDEVLLLEAAKSINLNDLTPDISIAQQRFKYSTRAFVTLPEKTHVEFDIPFNVNLDENNANPVWNTIKAWYDLVWNSQTGEACYKRDIVGTVIVNMHDKKGFVYRRVTLVNSQIRGIDGIELDWEKNTSIVESMGAKFVADYWIDEYIDSDNEISGSNTNIYLGNA